MQRILCWLVLLLGHSSLVFAQTAPKTNDEPKYQWFIGYSVLGETDKDAGRTLTRFGSNKGLETSVTGYFNKYFGAKADFSAYFGTNQGRGVITLNSVQPPVTNANLDFSFKHQSYALLFGPEFRASNKTRVTPFAHALLGVGWDSGNVKLSGSGSNGLLKISDGGLAAAIGGGFDFKAAERFGFRASADYHPVCSGSKDYDPRGCRDQMRISLGLVFH